MGLFAVLLLGAAPAHAKMADSGCEDLSPASGQLVDAARPNMVMLRAGLDGVPALLSGFLDDDGGPDLVEAAKILMPRVAHAAPGHRAPLSAGRAPGIALSPASPRAPPHA